MELHRIFCYGDSNTYGYDPRSYLGGRYPKSVRWTALLETDGWSILNDGQNGRCIPQREWEIAAVGQKIHRSKAEIVITMLGSNDLLQRPDLGAKVCTKRMKDFLVALGCPSLAQYDQRSPTSWQPMGTVLNLFGPDPSGNTAFGGSPFPPVGYSCFPRL